MTTTIWILGDQLLENHPALETALSQVSTQHVNVVMVESQAILERLPYHRQKLVLVLSAMRHYAAELRQRGLTVDYQKSADMISGLQAHLATHQAERLLTMAASQRNGRRFQRRVQERLGLPVEVFPNTQFLTGRYNPFPGAGREKSTTQESYYRAMRQNFNLLMETDGTPSGGKWNFDAQNRQKLPAGIAPPKVKTFPPDQTTLQVIEEVANYPQAIGSLEGFDYAVTRGEALAALEDFISQRLPEFGAYQDAMRAEADLLFHSRLSPYLNLSMLEPLEVAQRAAQAYQQGAAPINSVEGFIRQVIGWREFMYWQYWRQGADYRQVNHWGFTHPLPGFFWNGDTDMNCLRTVIQRVLHSGYAHHIERLMVLSNFCLLSGIHPQEVNDWFLSGFVDAYEWVMLPNLLGMGLYADGGKIATKPYIASANYIHKMSDYCGKCTFKRKLRTGEGACPFNFLYWNFLLALEPELRKNARMNTSLLGLRRLDEAQRQDIQAQARDFLRALT